MGLFPPGKGGGDDIEHGYKGKGVTNHLLVDGSGMPLSIITTSAAKSEREQVIHLIAQVRVFGKRRGRAKSCVRELQGDRGYDSKRLRNKLKRKGIRPLIAKRCWPTRKQPCGRKPAKIKDRFKVERCFAWMQKKFRRLCIRWEKRRQYWNGFILLGIAWMWLTRLLYG